MVDIGCNQGRADPRSVLASRRALFGVWLLCRGPLAVLAIWTVLWKVFTA